MKTIVMCIDGTANEFKRDLTNVVKLYYTLERTPDQLTYYHPGLGTMEAVGALTSWARSFTKLLGLAFGYGLEADVCDAYRYLMNNFEDGDQVYLFGFSRGSYTVRTLAAFLHMYGLIPPGNDALIPYAFRMMKAIYAKHSDPDAAFALARKFSATFSTRDCSPHFVGVWDTVSSIGWIRNPLHLPFTANNPDIAIGRHAVSIDERRAFFRQNLFRPPANAAVAAIGPKDLKQVWFAGVHCDVGGGYPEATSGLAKIALKWMLTEAAWAGLRLNMRRVNEMLGDAGGGYVKPDPEAELHNSMTCVWKLAEFVPKRHYNWTTRLENWRINLFRRRVMPPGSHIHDTVTARMAARKDYRPKLPTDAEFVTTRPFP